MIKKSKRLEAAIRSHWKALVRPGVWIDAYNNRTDSNISGTITTRIDACNNYFVTDKGTGIGR